MFEQEQNTIIEQEQVFPADRGAFFGKVMFAFGMALLVSLLGTYVGFRYLLEVFATMPALMWVFFAAELILIFTSRSWSQTRPINYALFALFAFLSGILITPLVASVIIQFGGPALIFKALTVTVLLFSGTALYGWTTKRQLAGLGGFLMLSLVGMIVISIFGIFFPWGNSFEILFSGFGVLIFSGFTMYDIQRIRQYPENRYIDAALNLYLDIFNMFVYVLRFLLSLNRN